ncbi:MAG: protein-glutamate O-methyltransferase CheR, partial [Pseudomonadota bacterium]
PPDRTLSEETFQAIAAVAYDVAGLYLPASKRAMVASRISRRLSRLALTSFDDYLDLISSPGAPERRRMVAALTTNVSTFFREPHHFDTLRMTVLPELLSAARGGERLRIWSAGSAHGQEAYSIALTILDLEPEAPDLDIRILGTDIDPSVVRAAALGAYHASMVGDIAPVQLTRYFTYDASAHTYVVTPDLRGLVMFRELNLHGAWPMPGRFDVIFCRNVVIYFDEAGQNALWSRFQDKLVDGGWFMVGHSERIPHNVAPELTPLGHTIYRRGPL